MKIRTGFVSNSSTSSFLLMATEKNVEKALGLADAKIRKHLKEWFVEDAEKIQYGGKTFLRNHGQFSSEETYGIMCPEPKSGGADEAMAFEEIERFFKNLGTLSKFNGY